MDVRNNTFNPNFTSVIVPKASQRRFMIALREECTTDNLLRCLQTIEKEKKNPNNIVISDVGYFWGQPCCGHLCATVNGDVFYNSDCFLTFPTPAKFLDKMSKKAAKFLSKDEKVARKSQDIHNKAEIIEKQQLRQKGLVSEDEQRNYFLGEIYKAINMK